MTLNRAYLFVQVAVYSGFVLAGYGAPARFAAALGLSPRDVTALADFSATYGGLSAGIAVLLLLGATRAAWERPALLLAVTTTAGLFVGRALTLLQHGPAGAYIHGSMAVELVAALAGLWLLRGAEQPAGEMHPA